MNNASFTSFVGARFSQDLLSANRLARIFLCHKSKLCSPLFHVCLNLKLPRANTGKPKTLQSRHYENKKIMKKTFLFLILTASILVFNVSCGSQKQVPQQKTSGNPFGDVYEAPCTVYDTNEEFAATGIYRGSMYQKGEVHKFALQNAQSIVRMKIKHAYKGMVSEYTSSIGNNAGNDIETKITSAGDQIIDTVVNNTSECCIKYSAVADDGQIECYVAIKIAKNDLSEKIAKEISNKLSDDEKMRINFNESQYREQMEKRFEQYKEENK